MAGPYVVIKPKEKWGTAVSHAPDCKWLAGSRRRVSGSVDDDYTRVMASKIPPSVGRCSHCGGGR